MEEINYITFILGYDLCKDKLKNLECDKAYDICLSLAQEFMNSEEYKNYNYSLYTMLKAWTERKELLEEEEEGIPLF